MRPSGQKKDRKNALLDGSLWGNFRAEWDQDGDNRVVPEGSTGPGTVHYSLPAVLSA